MGLNLAFLVLLFNFLVKLMTPIFLKKCRKYRPTNENYRSPFRWKCWRFWFVGFWQNFLRKSLLNSWEKSISKISNILIILGIRQNQQNIWFVGKYRGHKFHYLTSFIRLKRWSLKSNPAASILFYKAKNANLKNQILQHLTSFIGLKMRSLKSNPAAFNLFYKAKNAKLKIKSCSI